MPELSDVSTESVCFFFGGGVLVIVSSILHVVVIVSLLGAINIVYLEQFMSFLYRDSRYAVENKAGD